jgi:hypothetical protein
MPRFSLHALTLAVLAVPAVAQDQKALLQLIQSSFANSGPSQVYQFLAQARTLGLVRNTDEAAYAKDLYQAVKDPASEAAGGAVQILRTATHGGGGIVPLGSLDTESSDTIGFANDLNLSGGSCTVTGATGGTDTRDIYRFRLAGPGEWLVSATMTGTTSVCNLFDDAGRLIVVGLLTTAAPVVRGVSKICLPAGTYYINATGTAYTLTVTAAPAVCPLLVAGPNAATVNPAGLGTDVFDVSSWKFVVAAPFEDVTLAVASTATAPTDHNLFYNLGRANAGRVHFCDNVLPAPAHANDPVMKAGLPAGTYYLYVQNSVVGVTTPIPYTVAVTQTAITPISLCGSNNYTFTASGNRDLFVFRNTGLARVTIDTNNGTVPPTAMDSYIELFDANMGLLIFNDDGCAAGTGCTPTFRSYIDATLPAGTYYFTFRGFAAAGTAGEFGDYAITGACGLPPVTNPVDAVRTGPFTLAAGTSTTHIYRACCESPIVVNHNNNVTVVAADGTLKASYQQLVAPGSTTQAGTTVRTGEVIYVIQRTTGGAVTTAANVYVAGKLGIELAPVSITGIYSLRSEDKAGQIEFMFMTVGSMAGVPVPGLTGVLCLDVISSPVFFLGTNIFTNAAPRFTWPLPDLRPFIPPASIPGVRFQALSLDAALTGGFTNIAQ